MRIPIERRRGNSLAPAASFDLFVMPWHCPLPYQKSDVPKAIAEYYVSAQSLNIERLSKWLAVDMPCCATITADLAIQNPQTPHEAERTCHGARHALLQPKVDFPRRAYEY